MLLFTDAAVVSLGQKYFLKNYDIIGLYWQAYYVNSLKKYFWPTLVHYAGISLQCFDTVGWVTGRASGLPVKNRALVCWWWRCDWSFTHLIAPVVTTTFITLSSNKIQNGYILVPANPGPPGKWPLKRSSRESYTGSLFTVFICRPIRTRM